MRSKMVAEVGIFAALYAALVYVFQPISFLSIQVRIANALLGAIPFLGWSGVFGYALGVLIGNLTSPLGVLDLLSAIPSLVNGYLIMYGTKKYGDKGFVAFSVAGAAVIASWVALILNVVLSLPYPITFVYVLIGVIISDTVLGFAVMKAICSRLPCLAGGVKVGSE